MLPVQTNPCRRTFTNKQELRKSVPTINTTQTEYTLEDLTVKTGRSNSNSNYITSKLNPEIQDPEFQKLYVRGESSPNGIAQIPSARKVIKMSKVLNYGKSPSLVQSMKQLLTGHLDPPKTVLKKEEEKIKAAAVAQKQNQNMNASISNTAKKSKPLADKFSH